METPHAVRDNGWRQGCFLPPDALQLLIQGEERAGLTQGIIVSQDCDLLHCSFKKEPWAEILLVSELVKPDGNLVHGKSSKSFHFQAQKNGEFVWFEAKSWNRVLLPRKDLANCSPFKDLALAPQVLRTLIQWIAERYTRSAFPDSFVERTKEAQKDLAKALNENGTAIWRILVQLTPERELAENEDYEINVLCLVRPEEWNDPKIKANAENAWKDITATLEKIKGVDVGTLEFGSTDEFVISELFNYQAWDVFNYLTHRDRLDGDED